MIRRLASGEYRLYSRKKDPAAVAAVASTTPATPTTSTPAASATPAVPATSATSEAAPVDGADADAGAAVARASKAASSERERSSPHTFDRAAAKRALDALSPALGVCRLPKGRSVRVELTFAPNGHVTSAKALAPYAGTRPGGCAASHLKAAHVAAFDGRATRYVYAVAKGR